MRRLIGWMQGLALAWGGPGLFLIGYLDSSFLSFPEVNDLLIVIMVARHHERLVYYALMATLGSLVGCLTLYFIARAGGEAFLRRRFKEHHVEGGLRLFQRYGILVVIVPALLPPPAPFKIFILLAGAVGIPLWQFASAVFIARFIRYFGEGLLAVFYGENAAVFLRAHATQMGLWLAGIATVAGAVWILWTKKPVRKRTR